MKTQLCGEAINVLLNAGDVGLGLPSPQLIKSRVTYKELLPVTMQDWRSSDNLQKLKDLIHYEDEDNYRNTLNEIKIMRERKRYEHCARQKKLRKNRSFHIYGTEQLFEPDCLKGWVKLYLHLNPAS